MTKQEISTLLDCWEAGMDFETAYMCAMGDNFCYLYDARLVWAEQERKFNEE